MDIKIFKGNAFEIGQQQGKIYKENGMSFDKVKINSNLFKKQLKIYQKYYPDLLDELKGIAEGGNFNEEKLIYNFITGEISYYTDLFRIDKACTIFGYKSDQNLFVGRNYDWIPEAKKTFQIYKIISPNKNSFIAITDMGSIDRTTAKPPYLFYYADDAINDKGLFIGITFAYADQWSYGISSMHMTKLIAENCKTIKDAINIFKNVPLCCPKNFFIADTNGDMVVVEHTSKKFKILYPENNILIQSNHYVDIELAKEDTILKRVPFHNSFIRYYETLQKINLFKKSFNFNTIIRILGRKGSYTCQNFSGVKTIWTLALDMTSRKYKIYYNHHEARRVKELKI